MRSCLGRVTGDNGHDAKEDLSRRLLWDTTAGAREFLKGKPTPSSKLAQYREMVDQLRTIVGSDQNPEKRVEAFRKFVTDNSPIRNPISAAMVQTAVGGTVATNRDAMDAFLSELAKSSSIVSRNESRSVEKRLEIEVQQTQAAIVRTREAAEEEAGERAFAKIQEVLRRCYARSRSDRNYCDLPDERLRRACLERVDAEERVCTADKERTEQAILEEYKDRMEQARQAEDRAWKSFTRRNSERALENMLSQPQYDVPQYNSPYYGAPSNSAPSFRQSPAPPPTYRPTFPSPAYNGGRANCGPGATIQSCGNR